MQATPVDNDATMETELLQDFIEESRNAFEEIEALWLKVEVGRAEPDDFTQLMHRLHLVSSVLRIGGHDLVAQLAERIISMLDRVQNSQLPSGVMVNDVILFAIENLESFTEALMASQPLDTDIVQQKSDALRRMLECDAANLPQTAESVLATFTRKRLGVPTATPSSSDDAPHSETETAPGIQASFQTLPHPSIDNAKRAGDLAFFKGLNARFERCYPEFFGRGERIWRIADAMNQQAGLPVDPLQLEAAAYIHDFGMAFLPAEPLRNTSTLSDDDRRQLHEHPLTGAELLIHVRDWDEAAKMVLQHHERHDGLGYPERISGDAICDGAMILAIADTIYAMTHKQAYRSFARPLFRAVAEINSCTDTQFSKHWVGIFNAVIRSKRESILFDA